MSAVPASGCYNKDGLEFLFQFNLVIHFYLGHLESKPSTITYREDFYLREGSAIYTPVNS